MLTDLINQSPKPQSSIEYNELVKLYFETKLMPGLEKYTTEADLYWTKRNEACKHLASVKDSVELELSTLLPEFSVVLMSSYGAKMHLTDNSDIDFGILVESLTDDVALNCRIRLESVGYKFNSVINNYYSHTKFVDQVEIEVKVRDKQMSMQIVKLHECLDSLDVHTQKLLTYAKSQTINDPPTYKLLKSMIYSAYYTKIII